jgi:hypothetical protein
MVYQKVLKKNQKYGSPCPVRCAENSMFSEGELYLLSRLFLTNPESTVTVQSLKLLIITVSKFMMVI